MTEDRSLKAEAYVAALWEFPNLCVALFGIQFRDPDARQSYAASGIEAEMADAFDKAGPDGLLLNRPLMSPEGPLLLQYWRSYEDLDRWARKQPHSRWWLWLMENADQGVGFYHEIYAVKSAESIFEAGTAPVGPARFARTEPVKGGEGKSRERMRRFARGQNGCQR